MKYKILKLLQIICLFAAAFNKADSSESNSQCLSIVNQESWQDSTFLNSAAGRSNDGNTNQDWREGSCSHTATTPGNHWWAVKLGTEEYSFNMLKIYNRVDCCQNFLNNLTIYTSSNDEFDPNNPLDGMNACSTFKTDSTVPDIINILTNNTCTGKYVMLYLRNRSPLHMCEVKVCNKVTDRKVFYHAFGYQITHSGASTFCKARGGRLAKIYTEAEQKSVLALRLSSDNYWFDLKMKISSKFDFSDGSVPDFTPWSGNKLLQDNTYCGMLDRKEQYKWSLGNCTDRKEVICEFNEQYKEGEPCICSATTDPHYTLFDKQSLSYFGICKYTMVQFNRTGDECRFDVEVKNEYRYKSTQTSYTRLVDVKMFGHTFRLHQGQVLYVDDKIQKVPYALGDQIIVRYSGGVLQLTAPICDLAVSFDGQTNALVKTGGMYRNRLWGLCGNCDGIKNDFRLRNGTDVSKEFQFQNLIGDSYETFDDSDKSDKECLPAKPQPKEICKTEELKKQVQDEKWCGLDKTTIPGLKECLASSKVNVSDWKKNCEADVCFNSDDKNAMFKLKCEIIKGLVETCTQEGFLQIDWRRFYECPMECGDNKQYNVSVDPCPLTCEDLQNGKTQNYCPNLPRREGCECKPGYVLKGRICVLKDSCKPVTDKLPPKPDPPGRNKSCDCLVIGDPHFKTFDGEWIHYQGICKYTLARFAGEGDECSFDIEVKNEHRGRNTQVSYVRLVDVKIHGKVYRLHLNKQLLVDGVATKVPYNDEKVRVFFSGNVLQFQAVECDVFVSFDGIHQVQVKVSGKYAEQLTGICGDCDGIQNDLRTKEGKDVSKERNRFNLIGDSFQVKDDSDKPVEKCDPTPPPPDEICDKNKKLLVQQSNACGIDKAPIPKLQECLKHPDFDVKEWKESCEQDLCYNFDNPTERQNVKCELIKSLINECANLGFQGIDWRVFYNCPLTCGKNQKYVVEMNPCPITCEDLINKVKEKTCPGLSRREGCQCDTGFVLKGDECVKQDTCKPLPEKEIKCKDTKGEVVFVLDSSASVGDENWSKQLNFITRITQNLQVSQNDVRIGLVTFNFEPTLEFGLAQHTTSKQVVDAILKTDYTEGATFTGTALKFVRENVLREDLVRPKVPKIVVVLTDGQSNDENHDVIQEARLLTQTGTKIMPVGISDQINRKELRQISSDGEFIEVPDFSKLNEFINLLTMELCSDTGGSTHPPPTAPPKKKDPCDCNAIGDPHIKTFDGQMIHHFGICQYTMASYNGSGEANEKCHFDIENFNEFRGAPGPSYVRHVEIKIFGKRFRLDQGRKLLVDGKAEEVPFKDDEVDIFYSGNVLQFTADSCEISVNFDGHSNMFISVGGRYANELVGICGNCDGIQNDFRTKFGKDVSLDPNLHSLVGDSYNVTIAGQTCLPSQSPPKIACNSAAEKEMSSGTTFCAFDRVSLPEVRSCFASGKVNMQDWKESCELDICLNYKAGKDLLQEIRCEYMKGVMEECRLAGYIVDWRKNYRCPATCDENSEYSTQVDPCPLSCEDLIKGTTKRSCPTLKKREGCKCNNGFVMKGGSQCVAATECKKLIV